MAEKRTPYESYTGESGWRTFCILMRKGCVFQTSVILIGLWVGGKIIELLEEPFVKPSWNYYLNADPTRHPFETKRLDSKNHRIIYKTPEEIDKDERTFKRLKERDKSNIKAPSSSSSQLDIEELIELYMD